MDIVDGSKLTYWWLGVGYILCIGHFNLCNIFKNQVSGICTFLNKIFKGNLGNSYKCWLKRTGTCRLRGKS